ncbi:MAG TPA: serine hydroxymethyltransferase [Candidatus Paceibacterota bacterium]|nr:serine hydroxymethyltransferase [Candidatus Paceibacterota bacterium]HMP18938.1 serine hydroxymethyltransferase [Candidatus Paceibacterota bacterium]HMP85497.1 serine hydroxymethyltransferase [Candidatus Paceibacterota bacterium]
MKDAKIEKLIKSEAKRQKSVINLIASENYVSKDVLTALGSELTNKYSEGYPGKRYYGGNKIIDEIETTCQNRALKLFGLKKEKWAVNVQAMSGSPANFAVYFAILSAGFQKDTDSKNNSKKDSKNNSRGKIMGMSLDQGGHLTHGQKVSATGKFWDSVLYGVDQKTEMLDYAKLKEIATTEKPNIIVAGYTAYPRIVDWKKMREIADSCGAILMVDMSHISGLVAGKVYASPFEYADIVTTTTHKTLRGPRSALIFSKIDERDLPKKINKAIFPGLQGGPHNNQIAAVAVALNEATNSSFKKYAKQVIKNANVLARELSVLGWRIVSGGTDTHLVLVDVWNGGIKNELGAGGLTGKEAEEKLEKAGIIVNKNAIPYDSRSPFDPSGIRIGSAAETTRGKTEKDFKKIAEKINKILRGK